MLWRGFVFWAFILWPLTLVKCQEPFQQLLKATRKLVDYYRDNYQEMNLDGIYGLKVLEGQVTTIIEKQQSRWVDLEVKSYLNNLVQDSHNISLLSLSFLQKNDPEYYNHMYPLVQKPLLLTKPYRRIDPKLRWQTQVSEKRKDISEDDSDKCMQQLMGMGSSGAAPCQPSIECLDVMTQTGFSEYSITHQILYTILAEQTGCLDEIEPYYINKGFLSGVQDFQLHFCTNVFYEAAELIHSLDGEVRPIIQDLFMEQSFVCAILGFMEFLHTDWLTQILSWQNPAGCYHRMQPSENAKSLPKDDEYEYKSLNQDAVNAMQSQEKTGEKAKNFDDVYDENAGYDDVNPNQQNPVVQQNLLQPKQFQNLNEQPQDKLFPQDNHFNEQSNEQQQQNMMNFQQEAGDQNQKYDQDNFLGQFQNPNQLQDKLFQNNQFDQLPNVMNDQQVKDLSPNKDQDNFIGQIFQQQDAPQQQNFIPQQNVDRFGEQRPLLGQQLVQQQDVGGGPVHDLKLVHQAAVVQRNIGNRHLLYIEENMNNQTDNKLYYQSNGLSEDGSVEGKHGGNLRLSSERFVEENLRRGRKLLMEKYMTDGCLSHKTAVAAGVLSQYIRFFLDQGPEEFSMLIQINGINQLLQPIPPRHDMDHVIQEPPRLPGPADLDEGLLDQDRDKRDMEINVEKDTDYQDQDQDNEDKPQDYYREDEDEDEEDDEDEGNDENDQNQYHVALGDKGDQIQNDYDQEVDRRVEGNVKDNVFGGGMLDINPKHGPAIMADKKQDEGGDNYPYYYDGPDDKEKQDKVENIKRANEATNTPKGGYNGSQLPRLIEPRTDTGVTIGTSYAVLLVVMLILLYFMTKFVRRRRILIKYR